MRFLETNQSILNGHRTWWSQILNIGDYWQQEDRCKNNLLNHGLAIRLMRLLVKDQKYRTVDLGIPLPTRSVISGYRGGNMGLSELISFILEPIANEWEGVRMS